MVLGGQTHLAQFLKSKLLQTHLICQKKQKNNKKRAKIRDCSHVKSNEWIKVKKKKKKKYKEKAEHKGSSLSTVALDHLLITMPFHVTPDKQQRSYTAHAHAWTRVLHAVLHAVLPLNRLCVDRSF